MGPARRQNSAMGHAASIGAQWMASPPHRAGPARPGHPLDRDRRPGRVLDVQRLLIRRTPVDLMSRTAIGRGPGAPRARPDAARSEEQRVADPRQDDLLELRVTPAGDPLEGQGDRADDLSGAVDREVVVEDGASRAWRSGRTRSSSSLWTSTLTANPPPGAD
jgi:hypothetical protein